MSAFPAWRVQKEKQQGHGGHHCSVSRKSTLGTKGGSRSQRSQGLNVGDSDCGVYAPARPQAAESGVWDSGPRPGLDTEIREPAASREHPTGSVDREETYARVSSEKAREGEAGGK